MTWKRRNTLRRFLRTSFWPIPFACMAVAPAALLRQELSLQYRSAERFFAEPEDRAFASVSDSHGIGGRHANNQPTQASVEAPRS